MAPFTSMNDWCIYIALYCVLLYTQRALQSVLQSFGVSLLNHHQCIYVKYLNVTYFLRKEEITFCFLDFTFYFLGLKVSKLGLKDAWILSDILSAALPVSLIWDRDAANCGTLLSYLPWPTELRRSWCRFCWAQEWRIPAESRLWG